MLKKYDSLNLLGISQLTLSFAVFGNALQYRKNRKDESK